MVSLITFIVSCPIKLITVIVSFRLKTLTLPAVQMSKRESTLFTSNRAFQPTPSSTLWSAYCHEPWRWVTTTRILGRKTLLFASSAIRKPNLSQTMCKLRKRLLGKGCLSRPGFHIHYCLLYIYTLNQCYQFCFVFFTINSVWLH